MNIRRLAYPLLILSMLACSFPGFAEPGAVPIPPGIDPTALIASPTPPIPTAPVIPTLNYTPVFEPAPCKAGGVALVEIDCGWLIVPEDRRDPSSETIRLHVAIFRSPNPNKQPDPVIHLSGGPGSGALYLAAYHFNTGHGRFLEERDYILIDQRGTGYSEPGLYCPERDDISGDLLEANLPIDQINAREVEAFDRCKARLEGEGVTLAAYSSAESAADLHDLTRALGYTQVNLYGVSYGTRLALTVMRDYPGIVRSAILDSVYPLQVNLYTAWSFSAERVFSTLFAGCAADPGCSAAYPNLGETFYTLVDDLNASPIQTRIIDIYDGGRYDVALNGNILIDALFLSFYRWDNIPNQPAMIAALRGGEVTPLLERMLTLNLDRTSARAMQAAVQCNEEIPFSTYDDLLAIASPVQRQIRDNFALELESIYTICDRWGLPTPDPLENQAVVSAIPVLLLAGEYDPITPPEWAALTAETLTAATVFYFPAVGHWVMRSGPAGVCAIEVSLGFLTNPALAPDSACISGLGPPAFALP